MEPADEDWMVLNGIHQILINLDILIYGCKGWFGCYTATNNYAPTATEISILIRGMQR